MKWLLVSCLSLLILASACPSSGQIASPNISYIWSITGIEPGQVIMALNQNGSDLFGQAKYEPDSGQSWNAAVVGFVEGDRVNLVLTALKGRVQYSNRLNGTYDSAEQSIKGDLLQASRGNVSLRGRFEAIWINPDISSYTPAPEAPLDAELPSAEKAQENATVQEAKQDLLPASSSKSRFHDVRQDADRILTGVGDISQIPIGMGGSGLS